MSSRHFVYKDVSFVLKEKNNSFRDTCRRIVVSERVTIKVYMRRGRQKSRRDLRTHKDARIEDVIKGHEGGDKKRFLHQQTSITTNIKPLSFIIITTSRWLMRLRTFQINLVCKEPPRTQDRWMKVSPRNEGRLDYPKVTVGSDSDLNNLRMWLTLWRTH